MKLLQYFSFCYRNPANVEKAIKDILLTDAISRNSVFKNIRFDPRYVKISQIIDNNSYQSSSFSSKLPENTAPSPSNSGVIRKINNKTSPSNLKKSSSHDSGKNIDGRISEVGGSFKISKTDADITEKKGENTPKRNNGLNKSTLHPNKKKTINETSVTSSLYKISAVEKVTKPEMSSTSITPISETIKTTTTTTTTTLKGDVSTPALFSQSPVFVKNPFDTEPWIPILPNMPVFSGINHHQITGSFRPTASPRTEQEPIYTSFTNPGLSSRFSDEEYLKATSFKSHPLPVNKIPITEVFLTEPTNIKVSDNYGSGELDVQLNNENNKFIEIETVEHIPQIKNTQSGLSETAADDSVGSSGGNVHVVPVESEISGQGQVEVVIDDVYDFLHTPHTTKTPLVTLLPVKSNSGIGRPIRRRPNEMYQLRKSGEDRTFDGSSEVVISSEDDASSDLEFTNRDLKIFGVLKFATEKFDDNVNEPSNTSRSPKMDVDPQQHTRNDSFLSIKRNYNSNYSNILTAEELKQLAQISKVSDKSTSLEGNQGGISFSIKAVSSSSSVNQLAMPLVKKPLNLTINSGISGSSFEEKGKNITFKLDA